MAEEPSKRHVPPSDQPPSPLPPPNHAQTARAASADTTTTLLPSTTHCGIDTESGGLTAFDLIAHQKLLEAQAREAIPFSYTRAACTYDKGYIRQPLWACRDCSGINVCAGCSVGCHADHDLIELFAKRNSRCDCGAVKGDDVKPCCLRASPLHFVPENDRNTYTKNHSGHFCYCERGWTYDPFEESECMLQCLVCEEWFHESCTSLRPAALLTQSSEGATNCSSELAGPPPLISSESFNSFICDLCVRSHPILHHYIGKDRWGACFEQAAKLSDGQTISNSLSVKAADGKERHYLVKGLPANRAEHKDWRSGSTANSIGRVLKRDRLSPVAEERDNESQAHSREASNPPTKRAKEENSTGELEDAAYPPTRDDSNDLPAAQAVVETRVESISATSTPVTAGIDLSMPRSPSCRLPVVDSDVLKYLSSSSFKTIETKNNPGGLQRFDHRVDLFLDEGAEGEQALDSAVITLWRRSICRCSTCMPHFAHSELAGILNEEETYDPPVSPDTDVIHHGSNSADNDGDNDECAASSTSSSYDMAMSALSSLPRAQTLDALQGYARLREALFEHLKPFAREGKVVDEASVRNFFDELHEKERQGR